MEITIFHTIHTFSSIVAWYMSSNTWLILCANIPPSSPHEIKRCSCCVSMVKISRIDPPLGECSDIVQ